MVVLFQGWWAKLSLQKSKACLSLVPRTGKPDLTGILLGLLPACATRTAFLVRFSMRMPRSIAVQNFGMLALPVDVRQRHWHKPTPLLWILVARSWSRLGTRCLLHGVTCNSDTPLPWVNPWATFPPNPTLHVMFCSSARCTPASLLAVQLGETVPLAAGRCAMPPPQASLTEKHGS